MCIKLFQIIVLLIYLIVVDVNARSHQLKLKNDRRSSVLCSQFGIFANGTISIDLENFEILNSDNSEDNIQYGFTLDRSTNTGVSSYLETKLGRCLLTDRSPIQNNDMSVVFFRINTKSKTLDIERSGADLFGVKIDAFNTSFSSSEPVAEPFFQTRLRRALPDKNAKSKRNITSIPLRNTYQFTILVTFPKKHLEGLYSLYFHNCAKDPSVSTKNSRVNLTLGLVEKNKDSYLSAGEQPLPTMYFIFSGVYAVLAVFWFIFLRISSHMVYKVHYLMQLLIIMKALSLLFHGINYYVLGKEGIHEEGWAVMYYITHLLKGALLFVTIILIGTGWTFVKHMLSKKEKKVFIIIIPLQILANVAMIIIEESEEGTTRYTTWKEVMILVDLLCCGAILFPVIWSIRHLQDASQTDGKVAINLSKLKLFRQFYILIICYIYFTRIVVYLLNITVPFAFLWLVELFKEAATLFFLVITGYKFRPISNNPYLMVPLDEEEEAAEQKELEHVWSQSGISDGVVRVKHDQIGEETDDGDHDTTDDERPPKESSHAYD